MDKKRQHFHLSAVILHLFLLLVVSCRYYPVYRDGEAGYLRAGGQEAGEFSYLAAQPVVNGRSAVLTDQGWRLIDRRRRFVSAAAYEWLNVSPFGDILFSVDGRCGYLRRNGRVLLEPRYSSIEPFSRSRALVSDSNGFFFINRKGRQLPLAAFQSADPFRNGQRYTRVVPLEGDCRYMDRLGHFLVIRPEKSAVLCKKGFYGIKGQDGNMVFVNGFGRSVFKLQAETAGVFRENRAAFSRGGYWGFVDSKGRIIAEPQFLSVQDFQGGFAIVLTGEGFRYIDRKGEMLESGPFDYAEPFYRGRAVASRDNKFFLIDRRGRILWPKQDEE